MYKEFLCDIFKDWLQSCWVKMSGLKSQPDKRKKTDRDTSIFQVCQVEDSDSPHLINTLHDTLSGSQPCRANTLSGSQPAVTDQQAQYQGSELFKALCNVSDHISL